jgi:hypothetical protein
MGTKGRDALLWMFFTLIAACLLTGGIVRVVIFAAALLTAVCILYYYAWYLPFAVRRSRELGLRLAVLLPVNTFWAKLLLQIDRQRMNFHSAYEVHIGKGGQHALGDYLKLFTSDLEIARKAFPGAVFMWEASAPLPLFVRRLVRQGSVDGSAFIKSGGWPMPRFPFTETDLKSSRVKHGAIIAKKGLIIRTVGPASS